MSNARRSLVEIWRWPILLAVSTTAGLLSALLGQREARLPLCWTLLAIPLVVILGYLCRARRR